MKKTVVFTLMMAVMAALQVQAQASLKELKDRINNSVDKQELVKLVPEQSPYTKTLAKMVSIRLKELGDAAAAEPIAMENNLYHVAYQCKLELDAAGAEAYAVQVLDGPVESHGYADLCNAYLVAGLKTDAEKVVYLKKALLTKLGYTHSKVMLARGLTENYSALIAADELKQLYRDMELNFKPFFRKDKHLALWTMHVSAYVE